MTRVNHQPNKIKKRLIFHGNACSDPCEKELEMSANYYRSVISKIGKIWNMSIPQGENWEPPFSNEEIIIEIGKLLDEVDRKET